MIKMQTYILLFYIDFLLKRKGFKYTCELIKNKKSKGENSTIVNLQDVISICHQINKTIDKNLFFPKAECLHKSLIGHYILSKRNINVDFCLGVSLSSQFSSHAWLEIDGQIINDNKDYIDKFQIMMKL